ncbi:MAG: peptidylprolyl isomerase [Deltaproteobacteria bacterium]|nr:peptidylprolyl isomerase [Deltaproteobacteria bacterium]
MTDKIFFIFLIIISLNGCSDNSHSHNNDMQKKIDKIDKNIISNANGAKFIIAEVNGNPVYKDEITSIIKQNPELNIDDALDRSINNTLLLQAAKKSGLIQMADIESETQKQLAMIFLTETAENFNLNDISDELVEKQFKDKNYIYNHETLRSVTNALITVKKNIRDSDEAESIANEIFNEVKDIKSEDEFRKVINLFNKKYEKIKTETLPPFEASSNRFMKPFVDATFAVKYPLQKVSKPVETKYGWHIIFIVDEIPPKHLNKTDAFIEIRKSLIKSERTKYMKKMIDDIYEQSNPFIYDQKLKMY